MTSPDTDRALLELAARAAGFTDHTYCELSGGDPVLYCRGAHIGIWAPLTDDGDAMRLATTLSVSIKFTAIRVICKRGSAVARRRFGQDKAASTRRAIVEVAAALEPA
jgi:hypothetical protein